MRCIAAHPCPLANLDFLLLGSGEAASVQPVWQGVCLCEEDAAPPPAESCRYRGGQSSRAQASQSQSSILPAGIPSYKNTVAIIPRPIAESCRNRGGHSGRTQASQSQSSILPGVPSNQTSQSQNSILPRIPSSKN